MTSGSWSIKSKTVAMISADARGRFDRSRRLRGEAVMKSRFWTMLKIARGWMGTSNARSALVVSLITGLLAVGTGNSAQPAEVTVPQISPAQFNELRDLIRPKPGGYADVPWMTDLWQARKKAAAEGKPILLWVGDGHPLGWT
jgi:hypothetical protein